MLSDPDKIYPGQVLRIPVQHDRSGAALRAARTEQHVLGGQHRLRR